MTQHHLILDIVLYIVGEYINNAPNSWKSDNNRTGKKQRNYTKNEAETIISDNFTRSNRENKRTKNDNWIEL